MSDDSLALLSAEIEAPERAFVDALVQTPDWNLSEAERVAGLTPNAGQRLIRKEGVRRYLAAVLADRRERHKDIRDQVIQALWQLATYDIKDLVDESDADMDRVPESLDEALAYLAGGRLKPPHKLPDALRAAVKGVKLGKQGWEYTFVDRASILLALAKHFGDVDPGKGGGASGETIEVVYYTTADDKKTPDP